MVAHIKTVSICFQLNCGAMEPCRLNTNDQCSAESQCEDTKLNEEV